MINAMTVTYECDEKTNPIPESVIAERKDLIKREINKVQYTNPFFSNAQSIHFPHPIISGYIAYDTQKSSLPLNWANPFPESIAKAILAIGLSNVNHINIVDLDVLKCGTMDNSIINEINDTAIFFEKILAIQKENKMKALEDIYEKFYIVFKNKNYSLADYILKTVKIEKLELSCMLAFLSSTLMYKSMLSARQDLYDTIFNYIHTNYSDRADNLLMGLK